MPNRKQLIGYCRRCGRPREEGERFSARGRCVDCGEGEMIENVRELKAHDGPRFQRWRRACAAAFGAVLADDPDPDEEGA